MDRNQSGKRKKEYVWDSHVQRFGSEVRNLCKEIKDAQYYSVAEWKAEEVRNKTRKIRRGPCYNWLCKSC